jgi:hypothetical protein
MTAIVGDYATIQHALQAATGRLCAAPHSARIAAAEAVAQLYQRQDGVITGHQLAAICHAARTAPAGDSRSTHNPMSHAPTAPGAMD